MLRASNDRKPKLRYRAEQDALAEVATQFTAGQLIEHKEEPPLLPESVAMMIPAAKQYCESFGNSPSAATTEHTEQPEQGKAIKFIVPSLEKSITIARALTEKADEILEAHMARYPKFNRTQSEDEGQHTGKIMLDDPDLYHSNLTSIVAALHEEVKSFVREETQSDARGGYVNSWQRAMVAAQLAQARTQLVAERVRCVDLQQEIVHLRDVIDKLHRRGAHRTKGRRKKHRRLNEVDAQEIAESHERELMVQHDSPENKHTGSETDRPESPLLHNPLPPANSHASSQWLKKEIQAATSVLKRIEELANSCIRPPSKISKALPESVAIVFVEAQDMAAAWEAAPETAFSALHQFTKIVGRSADEWVGYSVGTRSLTEEPTTLGFVFRSLPSAVSFCNSVHLELLSEDWPVLFPDSQPRGSVFSTRSSRGSDQDLWNGIRARVVLHVGGVESFQEQNGTFFGGPALDAAKILLEFTFGGEVLLTAAAHKAVATNLSQWGIAASIAEIHVGSRIPEDRAKSLPGEKLFSLLPLALQGRRAQFSKTPPKDPGLRALLSSEEVRLKSRVQTLHDAEAFISDAMMKHLAVRSLYEKQTAKIRSLKSQNGKVIRQIMENEEEIRRLRQLAESRKGTAAPSGQLGGTVGDLGPSTAVEVYLGRVRDPRRNSLQDEVDALKESHSALEEENIQLRQAVELLQSAIVPLHIRILQQLAEGITRFCSMAGDLIKSGLVFEDFCVPTDTVHDVDSPALHVQWVEGLSTSVRLRDNGYHKLLKIWGLLTSSKLNLVTREPPAESDEASSEVPKSQIFRNKSLFSNARTLRATNNRQQSPYAGATPPTTTGDLDCAPTQPETIDETQNKEGRPDDSEPNQFESYSTVPSLTLRANQPETIAQILQRALSTASHSSLSREETFDDPAQPSESSPGPRGLRRIPARSRRATQVPVACPVAQPLPLPLPVAEIGVQTDFIANETQSTDSDDKSPEKKRRRKPKPAPKPKQHAIRTKPRAPLFHGISRTTRVAEHPSESDDDRTPTHFLPPLPALRGAQAKYATVASTPSSEEAQGGSVASVGQAHTVKDILPFINVELRSQGIKDRWQAMKSDTKKQAELEVLSRSVVTQQALEEFASQVLDPEEVHIDEGEPPGVCPSILPVHHQYHRSAYEMLHHFQPQQQAVISQMYFGHTEAKPLARAQSPPKSKALGYMPAVIHPVRR
eukprot:TRINITY_DN11122_c1_g1_i1.p1 TRINITY_DN11122_c1_g1~~TRINITY_DN11122_c1_g1_i1.p1  ORF type:complete len:1207 (+),score=156.93 TRINITY_DN11122_c1_g1_i1:27-3647(+)